MRCIVLRLGVPELIVFAINVSKELLMCALLHYFSLMEYGDFVAETAGREAVADIDRRFTAGDFIKSAVNLVF